MKDLIEYIFENKGYDFEKRYEKKFDTHYKKLLEEDINLNLNGYKLKYLGNTINYRPIKINDKTILIDSKKKAENVGDDIADFSLTKDSNKINLSLKYGNTVTYLNSSIKKYFPEKFFIDDIKDESYSSKYNDALTILNFFEINPEKFISVYTSYKGTKRNSGEHIIPIKDKSKFLDFIRSVVGYGYIIVHETDNAIKHIDVRTKKDMEKFIGNTISNAFIHYPLNGGSKTVTIEIHLSERICIISFRNKQGGIYPTSMLVTFEEK